MSIIPLEINFTTKKWVNLKNFYKHRQSWGLFFLAKDLLRDERGDVLGRTGALARPGRFPNHETAMHFGMELWRTIVAQPRNQH